MSVNFCVSIDMNNYMYYMSVNYVRYNIIQMQQIYIIICRNNCCV